MKINFLIIIILILSLITLILAVFLPRRERYQPWSDILKRFSDLVITSPKEEKKEEDCPGDKFITELYSLLRDKDVCFLNGAFVISDQDGKVFDLLTKCENRYSYRYGAPGYITHDVFMSPDKFKQIPKKNPTLRLDTDFNQNFNSIALKDIPNRNIQSSLSALGLSDLSLIPIQYEYSLSPSLQFLCDENCQDLPNSVKITLKDKSSSSSSSSPTNKKYPDTLSRELKLKLIRGELDNCLENKRETKGIVLFYPFQVIVRNLSKGGIDERKRYLYLKLEESGQLDVSHWISAFKTYILKETTKNDPYPKRRERKVKDDEEYSNNIELKEADENFYGLDPDFEFYNDNIRSHNEFFVGQKIVNSILNKIKSRTFNFEENEEKEIDLP